MLAYMPYNITSTQRNVNVHFVLKWNRTPSPPNFTEYRKINFYLTQLRFWTRPNSRTKKTHQFFRITRATYNKKMCHKNKTLIRNSSMNSEMQQKSFLPYPFLTFETTPQLKKGRKAIHSPKLLNLLTIQLCQKAP